jgi:hypothetical protein
VLYGESAVGKTSLIWAGVLPELEKNEHRVAAILFREWQGPDFERQLRDRIFQSLLASINRMKSGINDSEPLLSIDELHQAFCKGLNLPSLDDVYRLPLHDFIRECCDAFYGKLFFFFDQFEEYIYYHPLKADGDRFDAAFARVVNDREIPASFLLSLREDGLGKLDRLRARIPDLLGNILRLDHLDRDGAKDAIEKPLRVYNDTTPRKVEVSGELCNVLLKQADADAIELDEAGEARRIDITQSDTGERYRALALQAVLTRMWETYVEPIITEKTKEQSPIVLSAAALHRLASDKKETESETRFIVRTFFDKKLDSLEDPTKNNAAEILRGLVRAGGHKLARTARSLAEESGIQNQEVDELLQKLSSDPINLLRKVDAGTSKLYELDHDVMAFAVMDWSNRRRQTSREDRQKRKSRFTAAMLVLGVIAFFVVSGVIAFFVELWREEEREGQLAAKNMKEMRQKELVDSSFGYLGTANRDFRPDLALLAAIDSIATYRRDEQFVPPRAVQAIALANTVHTQHITDPKDIKPADIYREVPCVESADRTKQVFIKDKEAQLVALRTEDDRVQDFPSNGSKITAIGINPNGDSFGVLLANRDVIVRAVGNPVQARTVSGSTLADQLGIDAARAEAFTRDASVQGWKGGYNDIINNQLISALSAVSCKYPPDQRALTAGLEHTFTDDINDAYGILLSGKKDDAIRLMQQLLSKLKITLDEKTLKSNLASNVFDRATRETNKSAQENEFRIATELDPEFQKAVARFRQSERINELMETANELARNSKVNEAKKKYHEATELDSTLADRVNPETEWMKFAPWILADAQEKMKQGYAAAAAGDQKKAVQRFKETIALDPRQGGWLDPDAEAEKNLPAHSAPSSGTPVGSPKPVPSGSPDA